MATIETIYKCFTEWFNAMQFVSKAVSKEDTRPLLRMIKIEKTDSNKVFAYAADGYRLHIADISECPPIPEGLYTIVKSTKKELILQKEDDDATKYLNIWNLIPDAPCVKEFDNAVEFNCLYAHVIRALSDGVGINHKYLQDIDSDNHDWSMWYGGGSNPIGFKNNTLCAVIMPMAIQSEAHSDYHAPTKHYDRHPRFPSVSNVESDFDDDTIEDDSQEDNEAIVDDSSDTTPEAVNEFLQDNHVADSAISEITPENIMVCVG